METWGVGKGTWAPSKANCDNRNYLAFNYFEDACAYFQKSGRSGTIPVKSSGSGYFSHSSGKIVASKHLVGSCKLFFKGKFPFHCPLLTIQVHRNGEDQTVKGANILAWSSADGGQSSIDYALLDVDLVPDRILRACENEYHHRNILEIFGFPITTHRSTDGYKNADGSLRVSQGQILYVANNLFEKEDLPPAQIKNNYLFTDADAVIGNSGGPALTKEDCVAGIATRASNQGTPLSQNLNTNYMISANNPVWISRSTRMCEELNLLNLSRFVVGCPELDGDASSPIGAEQ